MTQQRVNPNLPVASILRYLESIVDAAAFSIVNRENPLAFGLGTDLNDGAKNLIETTIGNIGNNEPVRYQYASQSPPDTGNDGTAKLVDHELEVIKILQN